MPTTAVSDKMKIYYDQYKISNGVVIAISSPMLPAAAAFIGFGMFFFFQNQLRELVPTRVASIFFMFE